MIVFPKKVRFEFAVAGALLLGSCDGPGLTDKQQTEVSQIAFDEAKDALGGQISDLDSRISELERRG